MQRLPGLILAAGLLSLLAGEALAREPARQQGYVEERGGVAGGYGQDTLGGAMGYRVRDGLSLEAEGLRYGAQPDTQATARRRGAVESTPEAVGVTGMARVKVAGTDKAPVQVGVGAGGLVADGSLPPNLRQGAVSQADVGTSLGLSKDVSLRASGRYQRQGEFSDRPREHFGAGLGLRISF